MIMKKIILLSCLAACLSAPALADGIEYDRAVSMDRLPKKAQTFLQDYYPDAVWLSGKKEVDGCQVEYRVQFKDGTRIEFKRNGKWKQVSQRNGYIPNTLVPEPIRNFIQENFPQVQGILSMEQDRREIEVRLSNGMECSFSAKSFLPMEIGGGA